jgi:DNA-binding MarR family transcriptional regulator
MKTNAWLEVRQFVQEALHNSEFAQLDDISLRLLDWVVVQNRRTADPLYMQSLVLRANVASPATIYKSVSKLMDQRMIEVTVDPEDSRRRIVRPSPATLKLMDRLGSRTDAWIKSLQH